MSEQDQTPPCMHPRRESGNDYIYCPDCHLTWDYRKGDAARVSAPPATDVEAMRENLHATFNGGYGESETCRAFHHGMDTVCNVLAARQKGESTNGILPAREDTRLQQAHARLRAHTTHRPECEVWRDLPVNDHNCGAQGFGAPGDVCRGCDDLKHGRYRQPRCTCGLNALLTPAAPTPEAR